MIGLIDLNPCVSRAGALSFFDLDPSHLLTVALQPLHALDGVPKLLFYDFDHLPGWIKMMIIQTSCDFLAFRFLILVLQLRYIKCQLVDDTPDTVFQQLELSSPLQKGRRTEIQLHHRGKILCLRTT